MTAAARPIYPYTIKGESREHPERFTQIHQFIVNSDTGETVEVAVDPAVYRDDWEQPYEEDLNHYLHCNDQFYNDRVILRGAIFLNDRRYDDPNFRANQIERYFSGKIGFHSLEHSWVNSLCHDEVMAYAEEHNYAQYREQLFNVQDGLNEHFRQRYIQRMRKERLDAMSPYHKTILKTIYSITDLNERIIDFVGDKNNPEAQGKREIARRCINLTYTAGTLFFFRHLLSSACSKPH
ncbi:MAG: hypothetical protein PVI40_04095 [Chlamydiota bacterium]|jgi:hypothetical protein